MVLAPLGSSLYYLFPPWCGLCRLLYLAHTVEKPGGRRRCVVCFDVTLEKKNAAAMRLFSLGTNGLCVCACMSARARVCERKRDIQLWYFTIQPPQTWTNGNENGRKSSSVMLIWPCDQKELQFWDGTQDTFRLKRSGV